MGFRGDGRGRSLRTARGQIYGAAGVRAKGRGDGRGGRLSDRLRHRCRPDRRLYLGCAVDRRGAGLDRRAAATGAERLARSEEHTSELQSLMRISYAVFCLKKKK